LGSDKFIERHTAEAKGLKEIPRAQLEAIKPPWSGSLRRVVKPGSPRPTESMGIGRDRRARGGPLCDRESKTQENRANELVLLDCKA
jgi:hypothetical protein